MNPTTGSRSTRSPIGRGDDRVDPRQRRRVRDIVMAAAPFAVVALGATAYGFLAGNDDHPSLELLGAFVVAGSASAIALLDRSSYLRGTPEVQFSQGTTHVSRDRRDILGMGLVFLSVGAALIHFAVIQQHFAEYWLYGAFFIAIALFELLWAVVVMAAPSRPLYVAAVVINALTVAAYVITRTVGLLVGPSADETEKIGFGDLVATAFEILIVAGCAVLLFRAWGRRTVRPSASEAWIGTMAITVTALTVLALFSTVAGPPFVTPSG